MQKKSKVFYLNMVLGVVAVLFVVSAFNPSLVKRAMAAVATITSSGGTVNFLSRFAAGANPSNTIGDSIIYDSGTNIGIGTTSPAALLNVNGVQQPLILDQGSGSGRTGLSFFTYSEGLSFGGYLNSGYKAMGSGAVGDLLMNGTGDITIRTGGSPGTDQPVTPTIRFFIGGSTGNIGIGTVTPGGKLEIATDYGGSSNAFRISANDSSAYNLSIIPYVVGAGNVGYKFNTQNGATITNTMALTGNGNVGIGTTSPGANLQVVGNIVSTGAAAGMSIAPTGNTGGAIDISSQNAQISGSSTVYFRGGLNGGYPAAGVGLGGLSFRNLGWGPAAQMTSYATETHSASASGGNLRFLTTPNGTTGSLDRLIIDQNGNVGIGTLSPAAKLQVNGAVMLTPLAANPASLQNGMMWMMQ